jgi:oligopeptide transport system substrate-binding protein
LSLFYIGFNATQPPFDDPAFRQAFSYAVDKEKLMRLTTLGTVTTAYGILPPGMPGHDANLKGLTYDPQKARELLAASRYADVTKLPPIVLTTSGWGNDISGVLGGLIHDWKTNLGIDVTVRQLEPEFFLYSLSTEKNNLFDSGWIADYPDPQDFLDILFRSGSQNNNGGYSNPALDALLDQAAVEQDQQKRFALYQQAEQMIVQDAAMLPLYFGRSYVVVKPYVQGYKLNLLGFPLLNKVSISK